MFKIEDAVSVDTSAYELESPGRPSKSAGVVLAVIDGPELFYDVRVRLPLGATIDLRVPADKVRPAERR